jgi:hypothetical protein
VVRTAEVKTLLRPLAEAQCKWLFRCCSGDERAARLGATSASDCADRILENDGVISGVYNLPALQTDGVLRQLARLAYGFDYGRVTLDPNGIGACAKAVTDQACNSAAVVGACTPMTPPDPASNACAEKKMLIGRQELGGDCYPGSSECGPGLMCAQVQYWQGACVPEVKEGDPCFSEYECGTLVCDPATNRCAKGGALGTACSFADPARPLRGTEKQRCQSGLACDTVTLKCTDANCAAGMYCSTDTRCPTGTGCFGGICGAPLKVGQPCSYPKDCESGHCAYDGVSRYVCGVLLPNGGLCQGAHPFCASGFCSYDGNQNAWVCAPTVSEGALCNTGQGVECVTRNCEQVNNEYRCGKPAPWDVGTVCSTNSQCTSGLCASSKCAVTLAAGAACGGATPGSCAPGLYCDAASQGAGGACRAKKPEGAPCSTSVECAYACSVQQGQLRCTSEGREPICVGT